MKVFWITPLLLLASTVAKAQDIPLLAPLRGDAASLVDTLKFIEEKLPGTVNYMVYLHDNITGTDQPPHTTSSTLTQVSADAGRCQISFHARFEITINGVQVIKAPESDGEIFLKQVQEISLAQKETMEQRAHARAGHPQLSPKIDPPITLVVVRSAPPNLSKTFSFYDESLAERVSKALQHAVSLCGGGKPETF